MHKNLLCSKIFAFNLICAHSDLKGNKRLFYISEKLKKTFTVNDCDASKQKMHFENYLEFARFTYQLRF